MVPSQKEGTPDGVFLFFSGTRAGIYILNDQIKTFNTGIYY